MPERQQQAHREKAGLSSPPFTYPVVKAVNCRPPSYYRARYYDSLAGRFLSEDPLRYDDGWANLYLYVTNRPTGLVDSFGLSPNPPYDEPNCALRNVPMVPAVRLRHWRNVDQLQANGKTKWIKGDKYYHCMGNCRATNAGPGGQPRHKYLGF